MPCGPLKLQVAPLFSDLQAASASAGGSCRWPPPDGCAEAELAASRLIAAANAIGASETIRMDLGPEIRLVFFMWNLWMCVSQCQRQNGV